MPSSAARSGSDVSHKAVSFLDPVAQLLVGSSRQESDPCCDGDRSNPMGLPRVVLVRRRFFIPWIESFRPSEGGRTRGDESPNCSNHALSGWHYTRPRRRFRLAETLMCSWPMELLSCSRQAKAQPDFSRMVSRIYGSAIIVAYCKKKQYARAKNICASHGSPSRSSCFCPGAATW